MYRITAILIVLLLLTVMPVLPAVQGQTLPDTPEILWDNWGVPHIFSPTNEGLFYAFGWAQAQNHGDLILKLYGQARGRAAEYWGADYLDGDRQVRTVGIPQQALWGYGHLPAEFRRYVNAFAQGINDYVAAHPDRIGEPWKRVLPVTGPDILGHGVRVLRYTFISRLAFSVAADWAVGKLEAQPDRSALVDAFTAGSNAWAIGPVKSESGHAILVANPHQPWSDLGLWVEAHLVSPEVNVYGAALVGNPILGIAFNDYLGWTHTVNTHDGWELYKLTPGPNGGYLLDGVEQPYQSRQETVLVRQPDGRLVAQPLLIRSSAHGPLIAERADGTALALRVVGEQTYDAAMQWWQMGKARSLQEFEAALRLLYIPMFTIMYADRDGNILHVFNEQVPLRSEGDWAFWNNTTPADRSRPAIIPGDQSKYIWTTFHPYDDLPRVLNPASGWLQNANEPPWTTTLPLALDPADYPPYMSPPAFVWPRPQTSMRLLAEAGTLSYDRLLTLKQSTFVELTRWVLDDLIAAAEESPVELVQRAAEVLKNWDRRADETSVGAVLFAAWAADYLGRFGFSALAVPFDLSDPLNTPRGLVDPIGAVEALQRVAAQLELLRPLGAGIDVPYGSIFRMRVGQYDLPASGTDDMLGTFRTLTFTQEPDLRFKVVAGESYIAIIEFGDTPRAKVLLTYGNATQPGSPHVGDQLEVFAARGYRDAWRTRAEIEANLAERVVFR